MVKGHLTARHLLVLLLHAHGYSHAQIAGLLGIESDRVQEIGSAAACLLGAADLTAAAVEARRRGLI